jgi:putative zinc finger/helix-turn-helix YgiT family protein
MNQLSGNSSESLQVDCPSCGSNNLSSESIKEDFQYGDKDDAVMLSALIPVQHCASCGFSFTTDEASFIKHEVVCHHLGILTPTEVRGVRNQYHLSQMEFSALSKIGKASLARWETGILIQNQANDNLLYLLSFPDNVSRLKERTCLRNACSDVLASNATRFLRRFRAIPDSELSRLQSDADRFELFPKGMPV